MATLLLVSSIAVQQMAYKAVSAAYCKKVKARSVDVSKLPLQAQNKILKDGPFSLDLENPDKVK